jgi:hypothetical protein
MFIAILGLNQISLQSLHRFTIILCMIFLLFLTLNVHVNEPEVMLAQLYWPSAPKRRLASEDLLL